MKRFLLIIVAIIAFLPTLQAQTPVESLMNSFEDNKGVMHFEAKGASMSFARHYIKKSPMGPLADNVEEVTIMIMKKASKEVKGEFLPLLRRTMQSYQFYARETGTDGNIVEVYGSPIKNGVVHELVVYNPDNYTLFSLRGSYPVSELQKLETKK